MYNVNIEESGHVWIKKNLMTIMGRNGGYDELVCENCKMKGRLYTLGTVRISETYKSENAFLCKKAPKVDYLKKVIVITRCYAEGKVFENLTPKSEHEVVTPPEGYKNDTSGVWVMGVGEPVKVLTNEFNWK